eukprot:2932528-Ditylum_brightwellii.AAC.1
MLCMLMTKNTNIYHTEVPTALIPKEKNNKKHPTGDCNGGWSDDKCIRFMFYNPNNNIHPKIKAKFVNRFLKQVSDVPLSNICKFCNTTVAALPPYKNCCALYMMGMYHQKM